MISLPSFLLPLIGAAAPPSLGASPAALAASPAAVAATPAGLAATPAPALFTPLPLPANVQNFEFVTAAKTPLALNHPWITHSFATFFVISALGLIVLLAIQTTKQEGLSGTLGGRVESSYRPRMGFDQQLARLTSYIAIAFVIFATIISLSGI